MTWNWIKVELGAVCLGWWAAVGMSFLDWRYVVFVVLLPAVMVMRILYLVKAEAPPPR